MNRQGSSLRPPKTRHHSHQKAHLLSLPHSALAGPPSVVAAHCLLFPFALSLSLPFPSNPTRPPVRLASSKRQNNNLSFAKKKGVFFFLSSFWLCYSKHNHIHSLIYWKFLLIRTPTTPLVQHSFIPLAGARPILPATLWPPNPTTTLISKRKKPVSTR